MAKARLTVCAFRVIRGARGVVIAIRTVRQIVFDSALEAAIPGCNLHTEAVQLVPLSIQLDGVLRQPLTNGNDILFAHTLSVAFGQGLLTKNFAVSAFRAEENYLTNRKREAVTVRRRLSQQSR